MFHLAGVWHRIVVPTFATHYCPTGKLFQIRVCF